MLKVKDHLNRTGAAVTETTMGNDYGVDLFVQLPQLVDRVLAFPNENGSAMSSRFVHIQVKYRTLPRNWSLTHQRVTSWVESTDPTYVVFAVEEESLPEASAFDLELEWLFPDDLRDIAARLAATEKRSTSRFKTRSELGLLEFALDADLKSRLWATPDIETRFLAYLSSRKLDQMLSRFWVDQATLHGRRSVPIGELVEAAAAEGFHDVDVTGLRIEVDGDMCSPVVPADIDRDLELFAHVTADELIQHQNDFVESELARTQAARVAGRV